MFYAPLSLQFQNGLNYPKFLSSMPPLSTDRLDLTCGSSNALSLHFNRSIRHRLRFGGDAIEIIFYDARPSADRFIFWKSVASGT